MDTDTDSGAERRCRMFRRNADEHRVNATIRRRQAAGLLREAADLEARAMVCTEKANDLARLLAGLPERGQ